MAGQNPGSPTDFQYFYEDEVYKINNRGQVVFGLVLENYEANSSDQESDVETPIQKGEIRVVWHPSGTERVVSEKTVGLADRSLMPGDVVRRLIAGKDTQRGYCRDISINAAIQVVGTKHVIPCVASERLQPLEDFTPDLAVCLDSWVGTSKTVHSKLCLASADGSRLEYPDVEGCPLEDYGTRRRRPAPYAAAEFYPGQVVYGPLGALDHAVWTHLTKEMKAARKHKMHEHKFTVESVVTQGVSVHWQCRALSTNPSDAAAPQQPKFLVNGEDLKRLKLLNVFEPCTLQVGDRNFVTVTPEDTFVSKKHWRRAQSKHYRNLRKSTKASRTKHRDRLSSEHVPSRPKKRASNRDNAGAVVQQSGDEVQRACPSITVEECTPRDGQDGTQHGGQDGGQHGGHDDAHTEEKNDSGISPEPTREDTSLLNGDSKSADVPDNEDDSDNWENTSSEGSDTDSGATWSSRCSSGGSARGKRSPQLAVRLLRGKRLKRAVRRPPHAPPPQPGARLVVETLHTTSTANVVWQDGTIEMGIPSTQLYPIHHLDGQECFPGDFVVSGAAATNDDSQVNHREYGVVQKVDHHGRTAIVKWFRTYTSTEEPIPQMLHESEVSVYDLKDHPDFQYRPGTVVIRVANFTGDDANCTAGQVIDNFPSGRVKVWWVDGHTSMCWPQDLYKVGEYDSEDGELWASDGSASDDSWETQSSAHEHEHEPRTPDRERDRERDRDRERERDDKLPDSPAALAPALAAPPDSATAPLLDELEESGEQRGEGGEGCEAVPRLLEPRVAAHMERGRLAITRLEEMFSREPKLQSQAIMRKLLNVYKECRFLDRLMGTSFFHEEHFLGLLERVRERGAMAPAAGERRVHEQLTRLFTPTDDAPAPEFGASDKDDSGMMVDGEDSLPHNAIIAANVSVGDSDGVSVSGEPMQVEPFGESGEKRSSLGVDGKGSIVNSTNSTNSEFVVSSNLAEGGATDGSAENPSRNVCYKLCSLINAQLLKAHAEVSRRRPAALAEFLNKYVSKNRARDDSAPAYQFSVQYGQLVVSLSDELKKSDNQADAASTGTGSSKDSGSTVYSSAQSETAPLASAESAEIEPVAPPLDEEETGEGFCVLESAPAGHKFRLSILQPSEPRAFYSAVKREIKLLKSDLPSGVWVRGFEDRIDLLSVMIAGPKRTPYEDGLFLFDVQLGGEYPRAPPLCHYVAYCTDRLNPNLYEDGKVCVSLLGTWSGRGVEVWGRDSSLLQVIVSLQGLILNAEPYFNEAGYEKQKGSQQGLENSRMYNEMVLLKLVQSMTKMIQNPPEIFKMEILKHCRERANGLCKRLEAWVKITNETNAQTDAKDDGAQKKPDATPENADAKTETAKTEEASAGTKKPAKRQKKKKVTTPSVPDHDYLVKGAGSEEPAGPASDAKPDHDPGTSDEESGHGAATDVVQEQADGSEVAYPDFPLIPASRGFCLTLRSSLQAFRAALRRNGVDTDPSTL